ncbi:valine--tRNA ligase [Candidatus Daviesbacteria bacterium RIFCSPHIGHO2_01_FULL_44_29]|uniref:Valine--tRNA ligase n=1 Tax=Candidatus Daviesbacteria bacterium RIFCSPHIGHO2_02_FULL_43_12 TaxID=1797776 RepID=A0A1F5KGY9_9BACT|nr:MAG: valine--tRNA ligase [Candidatus Daviesbacteria bacterium RIFCSPHIGHO2_01_FULL_44_29]OGE40104.1 MAG: valine--tRNA ligase [Candidatus Daviesbacteria bacterium RIFCSPHIGHO2_02_FULL_43_12]OGE41053.1 MAG: valine--tRNA ligase [Candidatus Daviesbacteria bacterium RIFCSPHIGHO2_12_FULL_47_45]OGE70214.1 MAG: valine--tRNA ligase [Candidatus Daviesbacteria bacterium RIFCSPLOWO2_01_FULL_43_15]
MDKQYDSKLAEEKWYKFWEDQQLFDADPDSPKPAYSLLMPPPNLTGNLHLGHAMQHVIMDALARFKRMQGFDVLLLPGVDHAGIQFEGTLEKLLAKENLSKGKLGRDKWLERAWKFKDEIYASFHSTWKVMGISADWSREVFTMEPKVQRTVFEEFDRFWKEDLLYKGAYIVQWCPKCGTAIEDVEMEYEERKEKLYYVKYTLVGTAGKEWVTVATARPETIFADVAIAVHPDDPRYKSFVVREARKPLYKRGAPGEDRVVIIQDSRVDREFGTGALKITPGHDPLDYAIGKDHHLPLLHTIDKHGRMTELSGDLEGLKIDQAREQAAEKLEQLGALEKTEDYTHSVPICERCKTTVEPLISEEWFVKMTPLAEKALANMDKINFLPSSYKQILSEWIEHIHDWSISRSLWWGYRIPVWYCDKCNPHHLVGKTRDMIVSLEKPTKTCQTCGEHHWIQDEQVLDTWFSSGMWPLATLGWPGSQSSESLIADSEASLKADNSPEWNKMQKYFPWSFELSSGEIKYLWIARMIMLSLHFADQIPFSNMFFHGQIRDLQGRKFSKSLGNGIDPNQMREEWGTDASRMALYSYTAPGRDGRANKQTMDERAKNFRNFSTKLWNIAKFVLESSVLSHQSSDQARLEPGRIVQGDALHEDDWWIREELDKLITSVTKNIESYQLHLATESIYDFIWHTFADIYLEKSKTRRVEAQPTLEHVLKVSLQLLHPFMPFLTEELWSKLTGEKTESIMLSRWPSRR